MKEIMRTQLRRGELIGTGGTVIGHRNRPRNDRRLLRMDTPISCLLTAALVRTPPPRLNIQSRGRQLRNGSNGRRGEYALGRSSHRTVGVVLLGWRSRGSSGCLRRASHLWL